MSDGCVCDIAIDCGSGGTRVWSWCGDGGLVRLDWPTGKRAPVLSACLSSAAPRKEFAESLGHLTDNGKSVFIGATAGLRFALENGDLTASDIEAFQQLLPPRCEFHIISPIEEARYELCALRGKCDDASAAMISMGGKSMQLGRENALYSLPFAMHLGYDMLQQACPSWRETIASVAALYESRTREVQALQQIPLLEGVVAGVTDTLDVAAPLQVLDKKITSCAFIGVLDDTIEKYAACEQAELVRKDLVLLARSLALRAVVKNILSPTCELVFREQWQVNWTAGYFLEGNKSSLEGQSSSQL